jgi:hypothetical protein
MWLCCDLITLFSTFCTSLSAFFAVIKFMLAAFLCAITTDLGAKNSYLLCISFSLCHKVSGGAAHFGAMHVQLNAISHHLNIVFMQA